jgi:hypothetical protein
MARKKSLTDQIASIAPPATGRPPNQSSTRVGSDRPKPKPYRLPGVQQNYASDTPRTNSKGESFLTFTRPDKPGMTYHEYEDPKTGKRRVVGMKKKTGPPKGRQVPIGG